MPPPREPWSGFGAVIRAAKAWTMRLSSCARCAARGKCMRDLDDEFADPAWGDWRNYCPNATSLSFLRTLHGYKEKPPEGG